MSSTALKIAAVVLVLLTLVLAALGFSMSRNYAARTAKAEADAAKISQQQQQAPQILAVVARQALAAYKPISRDDVVLVPVAVTPVEYFANLDEVVDRVPLVDIDAGAPVTKRYFKEGNILAKVIPAGHQALALEVNEVIAAGGFVRPGDQVDVLVYIRNGPGVESPQARVLLENARVLAFEERIIERPQGLKDEEAKGGQEASRRRQRTAVLAVPEADTTRVMLGANLGDVRLALRGQQTATAEEALTEVTDSGLPLSVAAKTDARDQKVPDKAITAVELSRVKPPPAQARKAAPDVVEVILGSQIAKVSQ
ncbi:MAG: Flp pilus assembly protein CpaB [Stagnimonas sp.]|nr:Flp pilus assembly protein CpaB [Stagnimonas sp.]